MALKGDRVVVESDITMTCDVAAERGCIVVHKSGSGGSGIALGARAGSVTVNASSSGQKPFGMLMNDVVSLDETRYHRNFHKIQQVAGEPVEVLRKGRLSTNLIIGTPAADDTAYLSSSGYITPTLSGTGGTANTPKVGKFVGAKDENGYAAVDFNFPLV